MNAYNTRRFFALALLALLPGCALYTNTQFAEWRGPSVFTGKGGIVRTVDGIEVWQTGSPNRRFRVLGLIQQSSYDNNSVMSFIAGASKDSEVIQLAKARGGDAIMILGGNSAVTGYTTRANLSGSQTGTIAGYGGGGVYGGTYTGSSSGFGIATTSANTRSNQTIAVIKYL